MRFTSMRLPWKFVPDKFFKACFAMKGCPLHKEHNAEDACLKARPVGRRTKASIYLIAFHHAMSMLSNQCLDSGFWAVPEFMKIDQSCLKHYDKKVRACARTVIPVSLFIVVFFGQSSGWGMGRPESLQISWMGSFGNRLYTCFS